MEEKQKQFEALKSLPFSDNPFFVRQIADSGKFEGKKRFCFFVITCVFHEFFRFLGNGTEGIDADLLGHTCQWIGNMNCTDDFKFKCVGSGIVDCTGTCPGDEDTLKSMLGMIQDPEMAEKFPMIAEMQNKSASNPGGNKKFIAMLQGCNFQGLLALMGKFQLYSYLRPYRTSCLNSHL